MSFAGVIVLLLVLSTLFVMLAGLVVMVKGGEFSKKYSNKLMTYRVWLQTASIFAMFLLLATHK